MKTIYLAGSAFWGGQAFLEALPGVADVELGLMDPKNDVVVENIWTAYPDSNYLGTTEVCKVTYDPNVIGLPLLLEAFFTTIDPYSIAKQINYAEPLPIAKIYYEDAEDEVVADKMIAALQQGTDRALTIECLPVKDYEPIGEYAIDYVKRNLGEDQVIPATAAADFVAAHADEFN